MISVIDFWLFGNADESTARILLDKVDGATARILLDKVDEATARISEPLSRMYNAQNFAARYDR